MLQAFKRNNPLAIDRTAPRRCHDRLLERQVWQPARAALDAHQAGAGRQHRVHGIEIKPAYELAFPEMPSILFNLNS